MSKTKIFTLFLAIVVVTTVVLFLLFNISTFPENKENSNLSGQNIAEQKEIQQRVRVLQEQLKLDPENHMIKRELARAYFLENNLDQSEMLLNEVIKSDNTNPQYYVDLGNIYKQKEAFSKAEEFYKYAITLNTQKPAVSQNDANTSLEGDVEDLSIEPPHIPTPYSALADLYLNHLNKTQEAIDVLLEGIKVVPEYPDFYFMLSNAYGKIGDSANAEKYKKQFDALMSQQKSR